jgi:hypothetical protein
MRYLMLPMLLLLSACPCKPVGGNQHDGTPALHTEVAIQVIQEHVPCDLEVRGMAHWFDSPTGDISSIFNCGQYAMGCMEPTSDCEYIVWVSNRNPHIGPDILPVWRTAFVNEVGYWVWLRCKGFIPEQYVNGVEILDPEFAAWMQDVNADTQLRAGAL